MLQTKLARKSRQTIVALRKWRRRMAKVSMTWARCEPARAMAAWRVPWDGDDGVGLSPCAALARGHACQWSSQPCTRS